MKLTESVLRKMIAEMIEEAQLETEPVMRTTGFDKEGNPTQKPADYRRVTSLGTGGDDGGFREGQWVVCTDTNEKGTLIKFDKGFWDVKLNSGSSRTLRPSKLRKF